MTLGRWLALLRHNGFAIDPPYWPRAAFQTSVALTNSLVAAWESGRLPTDFDATIVKPPIFILGHFRSGTTHLHNLLALDPQFAFPTLYQTLYPRSFVTTEWIVPKLGAFLLLRTRPHDNVAIDFGVPSEDELAILNDSGISPYLSWVFPRRSDEYDRSLTFRGAPATEIAQWKDSLAHFLKKLTRKYDRPIVLKSPPHTARIRLLLELFPDGRFVHIRRDPYTVFCSTRHMYDSTMKYWLLQTPSPGDVDNRIIAVYRTMYDAYFEERTAIPAGQACEIAYEALERDPIGQVEVVYKELGLDGFSAVRPRLEQYVQSIAGYRKNRHPELSEALRQRLASEWRRSFDEWSYPR